MKHPRTGKLLGYQVVDVGALEIVEVNPTVATALVTEATVEIERGDFIMPLRSRTYEIEMKKSEKSLDGFVVAAAGGQIGLAAYDIIYLDAGFGEGLETGNIVYLSRERKTSERAILKKGIQLPDTLLGSAVILETMPHSSSALILKSREDIRVGDKVFTVKQ